MLGLSTFESIFYILIVPLCMALAVGQIFFRSPQLNAIVFSLLLGGFSVAIALENQSTLLASLYKGSALTLINAALVYIGVSMIEKNKSS